MVGCQISSLCHNYIFSLPVLKLPIRLRFSENSLMSSMYISWLIFSSDLPSLYPPVYFLSIRLIGVLAIKIIMLIAHLSGIYLFGTPQQLIFFLYSPGFHGFLNKVYDVVDILYISRQFIIQQWNNFIIIDLNLYNYRKRLTLSLEGLMCWKTNQSINQPINSINMSCYPIFPGVTSQKNHFLLV